MRDLLFGAVKNGTGKKAFSELISIGGKTGTSQKLVGGSYSKANYNSSFVGFFPVENPQVVCLILNSFSKCWEIWRTSCCSNFQKYC